MSGSSETGPDGSPVYNELTYTWKLDSEESGTNSSSYSLTNVTKEHTVTCDVLDETTKASASATFNVGLKKIRNDTEGAVWDNWHYVVKTTPGAACQLKVSNMLGETASDIQRYYWSSSDNVSVENANTAVLDIPSVDKTQDWACGAWDKDGNYYYLSYHIIVETGLEAEPAPGVGELRSGSNPPVYRVLARRDDSQVSLKVTAKSQAPTKFKYRWYTTSLGSQDKIIREEGPTEAAEDTCIVTTETNTYHCDISDDYGNTVSLAFDVEVPKIALYAWSAEESEDGTYIVRVQYGEKTSLYVYPWETDDQGMSVDSELTYTWTVDSGKPESGSEEYPLTNVTENHTVTCKVSDEATGVSATATFKIIVSRLMSATDDANWDDEEKEYVIDAIPDKECYLKVAPTPGSEFSSYYWSSEDNTDVKEEDRKSETLHINEVTKTQEWTCTATDASGNQSTLVFRIYANTGLTVSSAVGTNEWDEGYRVLVEPGESVKLEVTASRSNLTDSDDFYPPITYKWYKAAGEEEEEISGADESEYEAKDITDSVYYYCKVSDGYGNDQYVDFDIRIDTGFQIEDKSFAQFVSEGQKVTLNVGSLPRLKNGGEYSYSWGGDLSAFGTEPEYSYTLPQGWKSAMATCEISDQYRNRANYRYVLVNKDNIDAQLTEGTSAKVKVQNGAVCSFTAQTNARYAFTMTGTDEFSASIIDQDGNVIATGFSDDEEESCRVEAKLTRNRTYYLALHNYSAFTCDIRVDNICQHSWKTVTTNATYTAPGEQHEECSICGLVKNSRVLPVLVKPAAPAPAAPAPAAPAPAAPAPAVSAPAASAPAQVDNITIPKKPASVKAKAKKNKVTVSWKKIKKTKKTKALLKKIKKVEIQYSTDKTFATGAKTKKVSGKKTKVTLKLKKKTTYYVRVRYSDGKGGYSKWSKVKKVKTKK